MLFSLDDRQRRELWGLGLLSLALLLALSLVPLDWFAAGARFPSHNVVGPLGGWLRATLVAGMGLGSLAVPLLLAIWGLVAFDKLHPQPAVRWSVLIAGLAVIAPAVVAVLGTPDAASPVTGAGGAALGGGMVGVMGTVGATILLAFLFAALCVPTIGWTPRRSATRGGRGAVDHPRRAAAAIPVPTLPRLRRAPADEADDAEEFDAGVDDGEEWMDGLSDEDEPVLVSARAPALPALDPDATLPSPAPAKAKRGKAAPADAHDDQLADGGDPTSTDLPSTEMLTPAPPRDEAKSRADLEKLG